VKIHQYSKGNINVFASPKDKSKAVYEEVIDIMEFNEMDMFNEYYAARAKRIDVYLLPVQPTEIITIKVDDLKKINPVLNEAIVKFSTSIYNQDRIFSKFYKSLCWKKTKKQLLFNVLNKKD